MLFTSCSKNQKTASKVTKLGSRKQKWTQAASPAEASMQAFNSAAWTWLHSPGALSCFQYSAHSWATKSPCLWKTSHSTLYDHKGCSQTWLAGHFCVRWRTSMRLAFLGRTALFSVKPSTSQKAVYAAAQGLPTQLLPVELQLPFWGLPLSICTSLSLSCRQHC